MKFMTSKPRLFDPLLVLRLEQRLREVRVAEVDAVELAVELRELAA